MHEQVPAHLPDDLRPRNRILQRSYVCFVRSLLQRHHQHKPRVALSLLSERIVINMAAAYRELRGQPRKPDVVAAFAQMARFGAEQG